MKDLGQITHGSLFTGIGGFDLAAAACGWKNLFYCETDPFCRYILKFHFPKAFGYEDIREADFEKFEGPVTVLSVVSPASRTVCREATWQGRPQASLAVYVQGNTYHPPCMDRC